MKNKIIDIFDIFERKVLKWNTIYILVIMFVVILIINSPEEVEVIEKVQAQEEIVQKTVETKKVMLKWNNRTYAVQVWWDRIETMRNLGYSETRILDLLAIMNMECWSYKWNCFNWNDIWPMQINKIHKIQYNKSWEFYNKQDWAGLFIYQVKYANQLVQSYEDRFCGIHIFEQIGRKYTNQRRWNCVWKSYNGHPQYKFAYMQLGWERREIIKSLMK